MIAAPAQNTELIPSGFSAAQDESAVGTFGLARHDVARVPAAPGEHDLSDRQRDDQRVQPEDPDEDAVDEADEHSEAERSEDRERQSVVRARADADEQVPAERPSPRGREVDARLHDHEHLAERGDREDRHEREDERPRGALERVRRDRPPRRSRERPVASQTGRKRAATTALAVSAPTRPPACAEPTDPSVRRRSRGAGARKAGRRGTCRDQASILCRYGEKCQLTERAARRRAPTMRGDEARGR